MDNLNINFKKLLPFAVEAFTKVYGEEYRDIISKKINNAVIIPYYDIEGLSNYIFYIKSCKRREYAIKFLDKIGVNLKKHIKDNYTQPLNDEIEEILHYYIHSAFRGFSKDTDYWVPLHAFKPNNTTYPKRLLRNKITIINYLLDKDHEKITEENFHLFVQTNEYQEILKKINELNIIYEQLLKEYRKFEEKLQPYENFIESEQKRKSDILNRNKTLTFIDIKSMLPSSVINAISGKSLEEKSSAILGDLVIDSTSIIESFSSDNLNKLKSNEVDIYNKFRIAYSQMQYLKNLGIEIPKVFSNLEEQLNNYLLFFDRNQDNIKKYIPSFDVINDITSIREKRYKEALKEYYTTRDDYINTGNSFDIYEFIKNKMICVNTGTISHGSYIEYIAIMFYTIRSNSEGKLFYIFMHECGHIIDQNKERIGFENLDYFHTKRERNPYDNRYRKYEIFNETLNDIFTIEAVEFIQKLGIYLIEPKKYTLSDTSNVNTKLITKKLLYPLLSKFRKQVISSKINANPNELIKYIGKDNFEELVDVVNKVDYLSRNGVIPKIDTFPEDEMVKEYFKQLEKLEKIYINIDNYYKKNVEPLITTSDDKTIKNI